MKSLMLFLEYVLKDLGTWCHTSTHLDLKKIQRRVEHEGVSFLTITLAKFGASFEKSLSQGFVGNDQFLYQFDRGNGGLPRFLSGFLSQVFDRSTGRLLDEPSITAIWAVRQFTLMWAKIELPCSDERVNKAYRQYIESERSVRVADALILSDPVRIKQFQRIGRLLWANVFAEVDRQVYYGELVPRHGPGATADRLRGNAKWDQTEWTRRLDEIFPHEEYLAPNPYHSLEWLDRVTLLEPGDERPVKVVHVPKTLKTPRIIAMEPTCMQFMQQALHHSIVAAVEQDDICSRLINGRSQLPNQEMARRGSHDGTLATLDLSEASDRVSNLHVQLLLENHPHLLRAVDATRSRKADVPGLEEPISLAKFASMGSALTFPMEAIVFVTIVFLGIENALGRQLTEKDVKSLLGSVRVFGDDIIVPVDYVDDVIKSLEAFGLKVNLDKSHWTGNFRESCGGDYFRGHDVSVVRVRSMFPTSRQHAREVISTISLRNQLYFAGMWESSRYLDDVLERIIPFPVVAETSPLEGRHSFLGYEHSEEEHPTLHHPLVMGVVASTVTPESPLDGWGALLKVLTSLELRGPSGLPGPDDKHLERAGRSSVVGIKRRKGRPY